MVSAGLVTDAIAAGRAWDMIAHRYQPPTSLDHPVFDGTDVVEFSRTHPGAVNVFELPVRPPLDMLWIESRDQGLPCASLVRAGERDDGGVGLMLAHFEQINDRLAEGGAGPLGALVVCPMMVHVDLDGRGRLLRDANGGVRLQPYAATVLGDDDDAAGRWLEEGGDQRVKAVSDWACQGALLALNVLAALNIRNTVRSAPPPASRQVRRARQRDGKVDLSTVTVLQVPGAQRRAAGPAASVEEQERAHHAVLGHFAYYGDTHPDGQARGLLFGRHEGVYWHPPTWRGNPEAGEVRHTYKVVPPEEAPDAN